MKSLVLSLAALALSGGAALADPVRVVAAENFYGDLARQIGGDHVAVVSILANPDQDPHLFEASPQTARDVAGADVAIVNGADYDPWMQKLLAASPSPGRREIDVGALVGAKPGANPHLWYGLQNMKAAAHALAAAFAAADAPHAADFRTGEAKFVQSLRPLDDKIGEMRKRHEGVAVAASEPVFGYAAEAAGLDMRERKFALAVMNDAEPAPSDVAVFESDLKSHRVRAMIYNSQASEPAVEKLVALAKASGVPVVGVTETEPAGASYQSWVMGELDALDHAFGRADQLSQIATEGASALSFESVTVRLGGREILRQTRFALKQGEFVGLLGANGAGKTTLLRAALGLLPLGGGAIRVLGRPAARGAEGVGYMPQTRAAFASARLTGRTMIETAAMGARFGFSWIDAKARREVDAALDWVDAGDLARRPVADLSGGERQRLLLAQALLGQPRLLLLDEPLISLDPAQQSAVVAMAARLRDQLGVTILFSAHELNPLLSHIDRVLYLGAGAAAIGTVDEVVNAATLSRLYGAEVEVLRVGARVFVMADGVEVDTHAHRHDHSHV